MQRIIEWHDTRDTELPMNTDILFVRNGSSVIESGYAMGDSVIAPISSIPGSDIRWFAYLSDAMPEAAEYGEKALLDALSALGFTVSVSEHAAVCWRKEKDGSELHIQIYGSKSRDAAVIRKTRVMGNIGWNDEILWKGSLYGIEVLNGRVGFTAPQKLMIAAGGVSGGK